MLTMDLSLRRSFDELRSPDRAVQGQAYQRLLALTAQPVDWVYEVWDELLAALAHPDNRLRSIAAQFALPTGSKRYGSAHGAALSATPGRHQ